MLARNLVIYNLVVIDTINAGVRDNPDRGDREIIILTGLQRLRSALVTTDKTLIGTLPSATHDSIDFINKQ